MQQTVIFACVHNAGRSQMAAAFFNQIADPRHARGLSAGTQPGEHVHPEVLEVMGEVGVDLSAARPRQLTDGLASEAQHLVTMGCGEVCPAIPGLKHYDWALEDPKGQPLPEVRRIRDRIRDLVAEFVRAHGWQRSQGS